MEMPRAHPRWGVEFDWLGVDQHGQVAVFTTAGYGPAPVDVNLHSSAVDAATEQIQGLLVIGAADQVVEPASGGSYAEWHTRSAQGFYSYDWKIWHGPYQRLSAPTVPIKIENLPPSMQQSARCAILELNFAEATTIAIGYNEPPPPPSRFGSTATDQPRFSHHGRLNRSRPRRSM